MIRLCLDEETPIKITLFKPPSVVRGLLSTRVTNRARSKESCKHATSPEEPASLTCALDCKRAWARAWGLRLLLIQPLT